MGICIKKGVDRVYRDGVMMVMGDGMLEWGGRRAGGI
jgi:hypothetical protein